MILISKSFEWDMGHRLVNHSGLCKNLHGHRYKIVVSVEGPVQKNDAGPDAGMIIDFSEFKKIISPIISKLDHAFMYSKNDQIMSEFAKLNPDIKLVKVDFIPTAENIVDYLARQILEALDNLNSELTLYEVELFETPTSRAQWRGVIK